MWGGFDGASELAGLVTRCYTLLTNTPTPQERDTVPNQAIAFACAAIVLIASATALADEPFWPPLSTPPQVEPTGADDVAVIVAIENYAFLPDIPGARTNASEWEDFFRDGLGTDEISVILDFDATHEEILAAAQRAATRVPEGANLWFVFIGHGAPIDSGHDGALVAMDARQTVDGIRNRSVPQRDLVRALERGSQANTIVILDACFSGRDSGGDSLTPGMQPVLPVGAVPSLSSNTLLMSAAHSDQFAGPLPGVDRPAFSYLLLGALRGWASNDDAEVQAGQAMRFVTRHLRDIPGRQQTPQFVGPGELVLTRGAREPAPGSREAQAQQAAVSQEPALPELTAIPVGGDSLPIMQGICGSDARMSSESGQTIGAHADEVATCSRCPAGHSSGEMGNLALRSGFVGNFFGDGTEAAVLETMGCGFGFNAHFSTSSLRRSGDAWVMTDYSDGMPLGECTPARFPDRDRLVCSSWAVGGGYATRHVLVVTLDEDGSIQHDRLTGWELPEVRGESGLRDYEGAGDYRGYYYVDATTVIVGDLSGDGSPEIAFGVTARHGSARPGADVENDIDARFEPENYVFREERFLRVWRMDGDEFGRAEDLEEEISHPYLRSYLE